MNAAWEKLRLLFGTTVEGSGVASPRGLASTGRLAHSAGDLPPGGRTAADGGDDRAFCPLSSVADFDAEQNRSLSPSPKPPRLCASAPAAERSIPVIQSTVDMALSSPTGHGTAARFPGDVNPSSSRGRGADTHRRTTCHTSHRRGTHTHRHTHAATWHLPHAAATPSGSHGTDPAIHIFTGDTNQHLVPPNDGWASDSGFAAQFTSPVGTVPALSATRTHQRTVPAACTAAPPDASVPQRAEHTPDATSAAQVASRAPLPAAQMLSKNPPTAAPPTAARAPQGCTPSIGHGSQGPMDWIDGSTLSKGIHPCSPAHQSTASPMPAPLPFFGDLVVTTLPAARCKKIKNALPTTPKDGVAPPGGRWMESALPAAPLPSVPFGAGGQGPPLSLSLVAHRQRRDHHLSSPSLSRRRPPSAVMAGFTIWRHLPGRALLFIINLVAATALIFEGTSFGLVSSHPVSCRVVSSHPTVASRPVRTAMVASPSLTVPSSVLLTPRRAGYNQGVYGTVSATPGFIAMAEIGHDDVVTDSTKQGGLAAAYYFGAMWACFVGGWVGDKIGRKRGTLIGTLFAILGAALQSASQNSDMFICARVIAGIGIGFMNAIILPWVSELSQSHDRGSSFSLVFVANYLGIVISYWINFGIRNTGLEFRWRFPLGWMVIPLLIVDAALPFLPESPRWLIANNRREDAIDILCKLRGDLSPEDPLIKREVEEIDAMVEATHQRRNNLLNITLGGRYSGKMHLGRRALMGFALQWIQQWSGILAIVGWAGVLFKLAGFDSYKSLWLSGLVNTVGVPGTAAAALVIDRMGRVKSLLTSFIIQAVCLFLVAALIKTSEDAAATDPDLSSRLGTAAASFVFIYTWFFTMFNIIPVWIYGTEIWPQEIRAKGYSFTIFGWATGCGMTQFLIPIMLDKLGYGTYLFFGAVNFVVLPIIWLFYPEVAGRSLEEVSLLFTSDSPLVSRNMKEYHRRIDEAGGNVAVAARRLLDEVDGRADASGSNASDGSVEKRGGNVDEELVHS
ncbi:hypothetical protein Purlil1_1565 [Purpureocillium lilacinum]|uniref:Major facilitator superfamily (MFS) profile domain-containing protein n=1 Tax=Purpureocillium lilacinum TaxID=33203 RepID=A0ABR0CD10_PURLI|nr:hypothetical protein Purlil1_1565 [Purpureocillium lilacinum]